MSPARRPARTPPAWLRRWEGLHVVAQVVIAGVPAVLILWAAHVWLLAQPVWRGLSYGVFWGLIATGAVVGASRSERARREAAERGRPPADRG